jgi:hypothetical protein
MRQLTFLFATLFVVSAVVLCASQTGIVQMTNTGPPCVISSQSLDENNISTCVNDDVNYAQSVYFNLMKNSIGTNSEQVILYAIMPSTTINYQDENEQNNSMVDGVIFESKTSKGQVDYPIKCPMSYFGTFGLTINTA